MNRANEKFLDRKNRAILKIKEDFLSEDKESTVKRYVEHHLEELNEKYWEKYLGTKKPTPINVLNILVLRDNWDTEDEESDLENFEVYDFTLPGEVTDYVIGIIFDSNDTIIEVSMDS